MSPRNALVPEETCRERAPLFIGLLEERSCFHELRKGRHRQRFALIELSRRDFLVKELRTERERTKSERTEMIADRLVS